MRIESAIAKPGLYHSRETLDDCAVAETFVAVVASGGALVALHVSEEDAGAIVARVKSGQRFGDVVRLQEEAVGDGTVLSLLVSP